MFNLFQKNNYLVNGSILRQILTTFCFLTALSCYTLPAHAQSISMDIADAAEGVKIEFHLPLGVKAKTFSLKSPPRLVVDVPNTGKKPNIKLPTNYSGDLVRKLRSGQFNANTGRIVLELSYAFKMASQQRGDKLEVLISPYGDKVANSGSAFKPKPKPKPKKKIVVLDAGHGGQDPGATGKKGTKEKIVVLQFVKQLKSTLEKTGRYKVVLTRTDDYYIALRKRLQFARDHKADIFISIHADSAAEAASGLSVYTLSENASDDEAAALAKRENKSDIIAGVDLGDHDKDVANILISLAQRETNNQSALLAETLVSSLSGQNISLLTRPHRFAGFAVLKAPDIPSTLIEIGFLSNRSEEKRLNSSAYRSKLAKALTKAIDHYFKTTSHAFD